MGLNSLMFESVLREMNIKNNQVLRSEETNGKRLVSNDIEDIIAIYAYRYYALIGIAIDFIFINRKLSGIIR